MSQNKPRLSIFRLIILIIFILVALIVLSFFTKQQLSSRLEEKSTLKTSLGIPISDNPSFGSEDAPITIIYFYDYQCAWCRKFDLETFPRLKEDFIDKGQLRFIFKDFTFLGPDSKRLAIAAECIYRRYGTEKFLEYHLLTYQNQQTRGSGWGSKDNILSFSSSIEDLDFEYLDNCIQNNTYLSVVIDDKYDGMLAGVSSTPTFFIGERKITGAHPYSKFKEIIETSSENVSDIISKDKSTVT